MGIFVDYVFSPFAGLSNVPTIILATDNVNIPHSLIINGITVCNLGNQPIRFNLQKQRINTTTTTIYNIKEFEVAKYQTIDPIKELGLQIFLEYKNTPVITSSLICFSNSPIQQFDCEISYTILNETPLTFY
jgi:hypothetical protein